MRGAIEGAVGAGALHSLDATALARQLMGDAIYTNLFLLGYAWQLGMVPVSLEALDRAIELNAAAVDLNRKAFLWGRRAAHDPASIAVLVPSVEEPAPQTLDEVITKRVAFLTAYQDAAYAERYRRLVEKVRVAEASLGGTRLAEAVARYYFKLLAIKDEYEVARLYAETDFLQRIDAAFEGDYELRFHLAPPLLARPDPRTDRIRKIAFGPWTMTAFRWLARNRKLRGTWWDVFGRTPERRMERQLIADYEADLALILERLSPQTLADAVELAEVPEKIRGFGHVKARSVEEALTRREALRRRIA
jgi:indolepyruvate ferredoxin oxidoreductase